MPSEIWYSKELSGTYTVPSNLVKIETVEELDRYSLTVVKSIKLFNSNIEWDGMWTLDTAYEKIKSGAVLFLMMEDERNPIGHVWFKDGYLHHLFVAPYREIGTAARFVNGCFNFIQESKVTLYCDDWNIRAQKFFEKIGFKKVGLR